MDAGILRAMDWIYQHSREVLAAVTPFPPHGVTHVTDITGPDSKNTLITSFRLREE